MSFNQQEIPTYYTSRSRCFAIYLYLSSFDNLFAGGIPEYLGNLTYLEMLSLRGGSLTGQIPQALFNMSSLKQLDLSNNSLSGSLPSVSSQCNLPHITGEIPENTFRCKRLEVIQLADNMLTGSISKDIRNFTFLQILNLAENNFTGTQRQIVVSIYKHQSTNFMTSDFCSSYFNDTM